MRCLNRELDFGDTDGATAARIDLFNSHSSDHTTVGLGLGALETEDRVGYC